jgi:hypothetical protein
MVEGPVQYVKPCPERDCESTATWSDPTPASTASGKRGWEWGYQCDEVVEHQGTVLVVPHDPEP